MFFKDKLFIYHFKEAKNVIPDGEGQPIPEGFVKVSLVPTDKAKDSTEKSYWVNPKEEVEIPYDNLEGKTVDDKDHKGYKTSYTFKEWKVVKGSVATYTGKVKGQFKEETVLEATYTEKTSGNMGELLPAPNAKKKIVVPLGKKLEAEELIANIPGEGDNPLAKGTKISYEKEADTSKEGLSQAKVKIEYPNGKIVVIEVPIKVVDHIIPQEGDDKPEVPANYVKVVIDTTNKATENTYFVKTYWVNPEVQVSLPVKAPSGKADKQGEITKTYSFSKWQVENSEKTYENEIKDTFKADTTIKASYSEGENIKPEANEGLLIPEDENPDPRDFIKNDYDDKDPNNKNNLPPGCEYTFKNESPDTKTLGEGKTSIIIKYPNGEKKEIEVGYKVVGKVVPQEGEEKPEVPDDYVKVSLDPTEKSDDQEKIYWVRPRVEVTIPDYKPQGKDGWQFLDWEKSLRSVFIKDTIIKANYQMPYVPRYGNINAYGNEIITAKGCQPSEEDYRSVIEIEEDGKPYHLTDEDKIEYTEPNVDEVKAHNVDVTISLKDGRKIVATVKVIVVDNIFELDKSNPENNTNVPDGYVQVIVVPTTDNKDSQEHYYAVKISENDDDIRKIQLPKIDPVEGKTFLGWEVSKGDKPYEAYDDEKGTNFTDAINVIRAKFVDDVVIQKGKEKPQVPDNYVKVVVDRTDNARKPRKTIYWVNPAKEVDLGEVDPSAKDGYSFKGWKLSEKKKEEDKGFKDISSNFDLEDKKHKYEAYESHIEAVFEKIKNPSPSQGSCPMPKPNPGGVKTQEGQAGKDGQRGDTENKESSNKPRGDNQTPPSTEGSDDNSEDEDDQGTISSVASTSNEGNPKVLTTRHPSASSKGSNKRVFSKVKTGIRSNLSVYLTIITISAIGYVLSKKK